MNLLNSKPPGKHIHNPEYLDYQEILKFIPKDWQNEIEQNTALPQKDTIKYLYTFFVQDHLLYHLLEYEKKVPT